MLNIEIDGKPVQVPPGSTVMDAANQVGAYVPHFCYHKKLSIAANCRMCLVQVEKAPKPLPACATPVTEGMKVFTASEQAKKAQQGVMEFLLINHPLDCPICDQGGECQLQDLSVGYGKSGSRFSEEKRVVFHKNLGPLLSAEEMSRCIHCTRCVRFGQEVAGIMELGMGGRGEHSEIMSFVGNTVSSELSGNMIDVCPVGALTSKPFRYSARTWELQRRKTVSPHDGLNANLQIQIKADRVMRVLPRENESVNECWISDRDRFSYEGLYAEDRLTVPLVRTGEGWHEASWQDALTAAAESIASTIKKNGSDDFAVLLGAHTTLEEAGLAKTLAQHLGVSNIDHRLHVVDPELDQLGGLPWLGLKISDLNDCDRILVVGSNLRQEQPLLAQRIRQRVKKGAQLTVVNTVDEDLLCPVTAKAVVRPSQLRAFLAEVLSALSERKEIAQTIPAVVSSDLAKQIAASLASGQKLAVLAGDLAYSATDAAQIEAISNQIASVANGTYGRMSLSSASLAAHVAGAVPGVQGRNAYDVLTRGVKGYLLVGCEAELDSVAGAKALATLKAADKVVVLATYATEAMREYADVILPITPFTETSGTYISQDGTVQSFTGVVRPLGESRPGWKVLRVLGDLLGADVKSLNSSEDVKNRTLNGFNALALGLNLPVVKPVAVASVESNKLERLADTPIYHADSIVRRGEALSRSPYGKQPLIRMNAITAKLLGLTSGAQVKVTQGEFSALGDLTVDATVADGVVRVPFATTLSASLGAADQAIRVEAV